MRNFPAVDASRNDEWLRMFRCHGVRARKAITMPTLRGGTQMLLIKLLCFVRKQRTKCSYHCVRCTKNQKKWTRITFCQRLNVFFFFIFAHIKCGFRVRIRTKINIHFLLANTPYKYRVPLMLLLPPMILGSLWKTDNQLNNKNILLWIYYIMLFSFSCSLNVPNKITSINN